MRACKHYFFYTKNNIRTNFTKKVCGGIRCEVVGMIHKNSHPEFISGSLGRM